MYSNSEQGPRGGSYQPQEGSLHQVDPDGLPNPGTQAAQNCHRSQLLPDIGMDGTGHADTAEQQSYKFHQIEKMIKVLHGLTQCGFALLHRLAVQLQLGQQGLDAVLDFFRIDACLELEVSPITCQAACLK